MHIRKSVHTGCPDVEETIKWSFPHFVYKGMLCSMASFKASLFVSFLEGLTTFWSALPKSSHVDEPVGPDYVPSKTCPGSKELTTFGATGRLAQRRRTEDPQAKANSTKGAAEGPRRSSEGAQTQPRGRRRPSKLSAPATSANTSNGLHEAKTQSTRKKRVATTIEWLATGKSRNWKYEKKR